VAILTSSQMAKVTKKDIENQVIVNAESGVITIRATHKKTSAY